MTESVHIHDLTETPHETVFDGSEPRTVRLALDAGEAVAPHSHPGRTVLFYLVSGQVDLDVGPDRYTLDAGDLVRFAGDHEVSPEAVEESVALVVLAPTGSD